MRLAAFVLSLLGCDLAITLCLLVRAAWEHDPLWAWLAGATFAAEFAIKAKLLIRNKARLYHSIDRGIFQRYEGCAFRQVSFREYFADSPDLLDKLLTLLPRKPLRNMAMAQRREQLTGEIAGVPNIILARAKPGSDNPVQEPCPTFFDTPDGGWIITAQPAGSGAVLTRFLLLHEMGHRFEPLPDDLRGEALWDANKVAISLIIVVQLTLPAILAAVALLWILYCSAVEYEVDESTNQLTSEVRADLFALQLMPRDQLPRLRKFFILQREAARKKHQALAREGYVRWQEAIDNCERLIGLLKDKHYWRLGTAPAPKYSSIAAPVLLILLSIQPWRWPSPPKLVSIALAVVSGSFLLLYSLKLLAVWFIFAGQRRSKAPFKASEATSVPAVAR